MPRVITIALFLFFISLNANACGFDWHHYGRTPVTDLIKPKIGDHVPNKFCKYAENYEIVIQSESHTQKNQCVGFAVISMRKRGTRIQQTQTYNYVSTDRNCGTTGGARNLEVDAALSALDDLMANLDNYKVIEK